jgi:RNA polymerase sigma-70 factor (ECF subfamily)
LKNHNNEVDKQIIRKIKKSDLAAFRELYDAGYNSLLTFAMSFLKEKEIAKDIVQETYLSLWENRHQIHLIRNINGYLYKNVKNRCLNYYKHLQIIENHRDRNYIQLKEIELSAPDRFNNVFEYINHEELNERIINILDDLPEDRQKIFKLSRFHGLKNYEIAEKLNISVRTVDTQIYRAMKVFKEKLKDLM